jgi:hypothetical protein
MNRTALSTPLTWRAYLYNEVLIQWELGAIKVRDDVFNREAVRSTLGLEIFRKATLASLSAMAIKYQNTSDEFLIFYSEGKGYFSLLKELRNVVAHADYSAGSSQWIHLRHEYKARGSKISKLRLFGQMRFKTLKKLVQYISLL